MAHVRNAFLEQFRWFLLISLFSLAVSSAALAGPGDIVSLAGGGVGDGGLGIYALISTPYGATIDSSGNIYIADQSNNRIRKIDASTGVITTVAGNGNAMYGGDNGQATAASLYNPTGVAVDSSGNIYIADRSNHRIRKVDASTGIITTVAGNGSAMYGGDNGQATAASLYFPTGVAADTSGNIYIADQSNHRIRKVDASTGVITTVAGNGSATYGGDNGQATAASLSNPTGVALDTSGNIYIADRSNNRIRKVDASTGVIATVAGSGSATFGGDNGQATAAGVNYPSGVVVDTSGNIYIADTNNKRTRKVDASTGVITTVAGNGSATYGGDNGQATTASLCFPTGVAVDASGNIYIADTNNQRIRKVTASTGVITTVAGTGSTTYGGDNGQASAASLYNPSGMTVDSSGNIYIADTSNNRIRKVAVSTGVITTVAGKGSATFGGDNGQAAAASLYYPTGVAVDTSGNIYIADSYNHRIRKVDASTGVITTVAGTGSAAFGGDNGLATAASLYNPSGIAVDTSGNIYIADQSNHRIRKVTASTGVITTVAGNGSATYGGDNGQATAASLFFPTGVAVDASGKIYIADQSNHRIRKVDASTGVITTIAGNGSSTYGGDNGPAIAASLSFPTGVAVDAFGNSYIADRSNNRVRKVAASTGVITTIAGNGSATYGGDNGPATIASLSDPTGVAVNTSGDFFIADRDNQRIRKVTPPTVELARTGQTTSYAMWDDGAKQAGVPWPAPRFSDNNNGTVTDNLTGLIWLKNANCFGTKSWVAAIASANTLAAGACGLSDGSNAGQWRLPNRKELKSLVNRQQADSSSWLNALGFVSVQPNSYWSSSTDAASTDYAWFVSMFSGVMGTDSKLSNSNVWPIRGGQ